MPIQPQLLDDSFIWQLKRLSETDAIIAIQILSQRLIDLRSKEYYLTLRVEDLPFSTRAYNALSINKLYTIKDIIEYGYENLLLIRLIGTSTVNEIRSLTEKIIERKDSINGLSGLELKKALM